MLLAWLLAMPVWLGHAAARAPDASTKQPSSPDDAEPPSDPAEPIDDPAQPIDPDEPVAPEAPTEEPEEPDVPLEVVPPDERDPQLERPRPAPVESDIDPTDPPHVTEETLDPDDPEAPEPEVSSPGDPPGRAAEVAPEPGVTDEVFPGPAPGGFEVDLTDPLGPVDAALDELEASGMTVRNRNRTQSALEGEVLTAVVVGSQTELLQYVLQTVAADGYQILLAPAGPRTFELVALRVRSGQGFGVDLVNVDDIDIVGDFRGAEAPETLRKFTALPPGGVVPIEILEDLRLVGYRAEFQATGPGQLRLIVEPGRAIRRVRVRGYIPLSKREVRRVLSPQARPGALAPGQCVDRRTLRRARPASICPPDDLGCRQWEADETDRLERYLADQGYLEGQASLGLQCGDDGEADLYVYLDKGRAFRVGDIAVTGNVSTADQRWIKRVFRPSVGPILPIPKRLTRKFIEEARERVAREYAEPKAGPTTSVRRQLELPYPGVRVDTNFDDLQEGKLPAKGRKLKLVVDVQLGHGVPTRFLGNDRISEGRLRSQLQLFKRREPVTTVTAEREAENLRAFYQARGFMLAQVRGRYEDFGALKQLTFLIDEGPRVRIRDIEVQRPEDVPKSVMNTIVRAYRKARKLRQRNRFTDADARNDLTVLLTELAERGYLCATARIRVAFWRDGLDTAGAHAVIDPLTELQNAGDPSWLERQLDAKGLEALRDERNAGLFVRIELTPGPRVVTSGQETIHHLEIPIPPSRNVESLPRLPSGNWGAPRILRDTPLRRPGDERAGGIPVNLTLDRDAEREISRKYRRSGYPLADAELRWLYEDASGHVHEVAQAERLTDPRVGLCQDHALEPIATVGTEISVYEGRRATFGTTLIRGNFKTRRYVLRREVTWEEDETYNRGKVDQTRRHIEGTGVVESVQIKERPTDCQLTDDPEQPCVVHEVISITESKDRLMDLTWGVGAATLDPLYAFVRPTFPNLWGTAWDLQLDGHVGANVPSLVQAFCEGEACYERSGRASLIRQRIFASPLTFEISGQVQRRVTPARGQIDSALGQFRLSWPIDEHWRVYWGYLVQAANISKSVVKPSLGADLGCGADGSASCRPPNRGEAIVPDLTGALQSGASWQEVDNAFNPDDGMIATGDLLLASPWLGGRDWWFRYELSWQHFIPLPGTDQRLNFRYALRYGHAIPLPGLPSADTRSVPEVWRYFAGGTVDLGVRGIEPQTMLVDIERIEGPFGVTTLRPVAQGGHIRALSTFALQFTSVPNFLSGKLAHSVFLDLGVLTRRWSHVVPLRDIRRSVGLNFIKWDIRIVSVSLGYAILIPNSIIPQNVRPTDDQNGRFVFDVGATF